MEKSADFSPHLTKIITGVQVLNYRSGKRPQVLKYTEIRSFFCRMVKGLGCPLAFASGGEKRDKSQS